jgi:hypothetical protein
MACASHLRHTKTSADLHAPEEDDGLFFANLAAHVWVMMDSADRGLKDAMTKGSKDCASRLTVHECLLKMYLRIREAAKNNVSRKSAEGQEILSLLRTAQASVRGHLQAIGTAGVTLPPSDMAGCVGTAPLPRKMDDTATADPAVSSQQETNTKQKKKKKKKPTSATDAV